MNDGDFWTNPFLQLLVGFVFLGLAAWGYQNQLEGIYLGGLLLIGGTLAVGAFLRFRSSGARRGKKSRKR